MKFHFLCGVAAAALCSTSSLSYAAIVGATPNANVSTTPYTIDLTPGSTLTFDSNASAFEGSIGVLTTGTTEVFSALGAPDVFETYATTSFPDQQLGSFQTYSASTGVPFSSAVGIVGFEFTQADGVHYGLADIGGTTVSSYLYDTVPGESVPLNATVSAVPEPSAWLLMFAGIASIGLMLRRVKKTIGLESEDAAAA